LLDFVVLGLLDGLALSAVGEGEMAILEELFEPVVELVGVELQFIAEIGHRNLVDEVPLEDGDLFMIGEMTTLLVHDRTSVQSILTRTEHSYRFD
jgi:hypothetical protein